MFLLIAINLILFFVYKVFDFPPLIILILLILGIVIGYSSFVKTTLRPKINLLIFVLLGALVLISLKENFDWSFVTPNGLDFNTTVRFRSYYNQEFLGLKGSTLLAARLGRLIEIINKFNTNLYTYLDLTHFFNPKSFLTFLLAPLFTIGLIQFFKNINKTLIFYFILVFFLGGIFATSSKLGFILYIPLMSFIIHKGLIVIWEAIKK